MGIEKPTKGEIIFNGSNIAKMKERELRPLRKDVQMIFSTASRFLIRTIQSAIA